MNFQIGDFMFIKNALFHVSSQDWYDIFWASNLIQEDINHKNIYQYLYDITNILKVVWFIPARCINNASSIPLLTFVRRSIFDFQTWQQD